MVEGVATVYQRANCEELFAGLMSIYTHKCQDMWKMMMHMKLDSFCSWSKNTEYCNKKIRVWVTRKYVPGSPEQCSTCRCSRTIIGAACWSECWLPRRIGKGMWLICNNLISFSFIEGSNHWIAPLICAGFFLLLPFFIYVCHHNKYTQNILYNGWNPVICAMVISR